MSLIDTRYPDLDLFLQRWQRRLNTRIFLGEGLVTWAVSWPTVAILAFGATAVPSNRMVLTATVTGVVSFVFLLWRRRRRLTRHQAASWLDEQGRTLGLFRAASECLGEAGGPADRVLAQANRRLSDFVGKASPRLPRRRLAQRGALALVVTVAACLFLALTPPLPGLLGLGSGVPTSPQPPELSTDAPAGESPPLTPHEAAQRLFPEDARLAALAEQALASGDPGALEALLEQNAARAGEPGAPSGAPGSPSRSPGQTGTEEGSTSPQPGTPGEKGKPEGSRNSGGASPSESDAQQGPASRSAGPSGKNPGEAQGSRSTGPQGPIPGEALPGQTGGGDQTPFPSGGAPGTGHSQQPLGSVPPTGTSGRQLVLKDQENPGVFEYVLPGTDPQLPSSRALADAQRSAEAIISRTAPPLEFENTIRDYFLSLTSLTKAQEASP